MTPETAQFLLNVLGTVTLRADDHHFEEASARIVSARVELEAIIAADNADSD